MRRPTSLFRTYRECCVCRATATNCAKYQIPEEPRIIALTAIVYRRGDGKGQLKNAPKVQVCEECLTKALTNGRLRWMGGNEAANKLWSCMSEAIMTAHTSMRAGDKGLQ